MAEWVGPRDAKSCADDHYYYYIIYTGNVDNVNCVQIFCVHGGIPSPANGGGFIEAINTIPVPLPDPEAESCLAWEMMWSDPLRYVYIHK